MTALSVQDVTAILLLIGFILHMITVLMWTGRNVLKWTVKMPAYLHFERGSMMAAFVVAALGISLLEMVLNKAGETVLSRLGTTAFLIGAVIGIIVECSFLSSHNSVPALMVVMVSVLFVAQVLLGGALLTSNLLPAWIGWTLMGWNLGWLVILLLARPRDIYYPVLHFFPLLLIAITLLVMR